MTFQVLVFSHMARGLRVRENPKIYKELPILRKKEPGKYDSIEVALRAYREEQQKPLLHAWQIKDDDLREKLLDKNGDWRGTFANPESLREATVLFFSYATPRFIVAMLAVSIGARWACGNLLGEGGFSLADMVCCASVAVFWMLQEWVLHDKLLHSEKAWFGSDIHELHHALPYYHISLDGIGLAAVWFAAAAIVSALIFPTPALAATATAAYTSMGLAYEFTHFISHTRVPLPRWLATLRSHHMSHHLVSKRYWLAFTLPAVDRLFGTYPEDGIGSIPAHERNYQKQKKSEAAGTVTMT